MNFSALPVLENHAASFTWPPRSI